MNFLYLNSDKMGEGDPELGRKLLLVFLEKLAASDVTIASLLKTGWKSWRRACAGRRTW